MHTAVLVPDDIPRIDLERALRHIGLSAQRSRGDPMTFERMPLPSPLTAGAPLCQVPGCQTPAMVSDVTIMLCAQHWLEMQVA